MSMFQLPNHWRNRVSHTPNAEARVVQPEPHGGHDRTYSISGEPYGSNASDHIRRVHQRDRPFRHGISGAAAGAAAVTARETGAARSGENGACRPRMR